jgi:hypothetical protein
MRLESKQHVRLWLSIRSVMFTDSTLYDKLIARSDIIVRSQLVQFTLESIARQHSTESESKMETFKCPKLERVSMTCATVETEHQTDLFPLSSILLVLQDGKQK